MPADFSPHPAVFSWGKRGVPGMIRSIQVRPIRTAVLAVARPPLALGTYGSITTKAYGNGYRARCRYRDFDGHTRPVERHGKTKGAAEQALRLALRDRARVDVGGGDITGETKVAILAEAWYQEFVSKGRSPSTEQAYRDRLDRQMIPSLGNLRVRELTAGTVDRHLRTVAEKHGPGTAKLVRSVLNGVCGLAVRHDALDRNPVRDAGAIAGTGRKKAPKALTIAEVRQLRAFLTYDDTAIRRGLLDFVDMMIATGLRIGECAAIVWDAVDLDAATVDVRGTVVRIKGEGLIIKPEPKSEAGWRKLRLPSWCVEMLQRRRAATTDGREGPVFPAQKGGLRDPSNTQADLGEAFEYAGVDDLTSHVFRKTVATLMDDAGLPARAAADQLGHSKTSLTQDFYFGRKTRDTGAAAVLESLEHE